MNYEFNFFGLTLTKINRNCLLFIFICFELSSLTFGGFHRFKIWFPINNDCSYGSNEAFKNANTSKYSNILFLFIESF